MYLVLCLCNDQRSRVKLEGRVKLVRSRGIEGRGELGGEKGRRGYYGFGIMNVRDMGRGKREGTNRYHHSPVYSTFYNTLLKCTQSL